MTGGLDIGRIISLIMENPKLIEEISKLGKQDTANESDAAVSEVEEEKPSSYKPEPQAEVASAEISAPRQTGDKNRSRLLGALKPYVSRERAQAIDSMLSVVEILDAMKGR